MEKVIQNKYLKYLTIDGKLNYITIIKKSFKITIWTFVLIVIGLTTLGFISMGGNEISQIPSYFNYLNMELSKYNLYVLSTILIGFSLSISILIMKNDISKSKLNSEFIRAGVKKYVVYKKKYNKKDNAYLYYFMLKKDEVMVPNDVENITNNVKSLFKKDKIIVEMVKDELILTVFDSLATRNDKITVKIKDIIGGKSLYLGVKDKKGTIQFSNEEHDVRGKIGGHTLIIGASGSGKSFTMRQIIKNWINPKDIIDIEKIFVINYKNSPDYDFLKNVNKCEYIGGDIIPTLQCLNNVNKIMNDRLAWLSSDYNTNGDINFPGPKIILIVDEIQTISQNMGDKNKLVRKSWENSNNILNVLASKARSSNINIIAITQKATIETLPSSAFRNNMRYRIGLKNDSWGVLIDGDIEEETGINTSKMVQGQFIFTDTISGEFYNGFTAEISDFDPEKDFKKVNNVKSLDIDIKRDKEVLELNEISSLADTMREEAMKTYEEDKSNIDLSDFNDINFLELAKQELLKKEDSNINVEDIDTTSFENDITLEETRSLTLLNNQSKSNEVMLKQVNNFKRTNPKIVVDTEEAKKWGKTEVVEIHLKEDIDIEIDPDIQELKDNGLSEEDIILKLEQEQIDKDNLHILHLQKLVENKKIKEDIQKKKFELEKQLEETKEETKEEEKKEFDNVEDLLNNMYK